MKLLSIAIPCYNSEAYMRNCIESLLPGGDEVEILIVDDGSVKDNTAQIADEYEARYPGICRAIHQENGGHGEAVNAGLRAATGIYFKVVDSDDWVNAEAYKEVRLHCSAVHCPLPLPQKTRIRRSTPLVWMPWAAAAPLWQSPPI